MGIPVTHLHLHTPEVKRAVDFYTTHLGMSVKADWGKIVFLDDGRGFDLALMEDETPAEFPKWFHFGSRLESAAEVRATYERLKEAGVTIEKDYAEFDEGYVTFVIEDPDGVGIEIYYDPTLAGGNA